MRLILFFCVFYLVLNCIAMHYILLFHIALYYFSLLLLLLIALHRTLLHYIAFSRTFETIDGPNSVSSYTQPSTQGWVRFLEEGSVYMRHESGLPSSSKGIHSAMDELAGNLQWCGTLGPRNNKEAQNDFDE